MPGRPRKGIGEPCAGALTDIPWHAFDAAVTQSATLARGKAAGGWEVGMTGVELILAALAAGAAAAASTAASSAVTDAYATLKDLLSRLLVRRGSDAGVLDAEAGVAPIGLGVALAACGADADQEVLVTAQRLLRLADADVTGMSGRVRVDTNFGAVGTFHAPVTITNQAPGGGSPGPPAEPGRA
jgi:hypothetical protein